jgi:hypothetical protein
MKQDGQVVQLPFPRSKTDAFQLLFMPWKHKRADMTQQGSILAEILRFDFIITLIVEKNLLSSTIALISLLKKIMACFMQ